MHDLTPATDSDLPRVEAFLARHADTSMILRATLRRYGLGGRAERALTLALSQVGTEIDGVLGLTNAGFALLQLPGADPGIWRQAARWVDGRPLAGLIGDSDQVAALIRALALPASAFTRCEAEPLYRLSLAELDLSTLAPGSIRRPRERDRALLTDWYMDFEATTLATPPDLAARRAEDRADQAIDGDHVRIFEQADVPLAMTAFSAELPGMVQIGGVYTPPGQRNRHAARSAVALHLAEARRYGVTDAVLAAASAPACRAYEALGFRPVGRMTVATLAARPGAAA